MAPSALAMHDPESLAARGLSPLLGQGTGHANTPVFKKYAPVNAHNMSEASQLANVENDAELTPFWPPNPVASQLAEVRNDTESTLFRPTNPFAAQLADVENDAESTPFRPPNPFGDEIYPASAGSSVKSKVLKPSYSIDSESGNLSFAGGQEVVYKPQLRTYNARFPTVTALFSSEDRKGASLEEHPNTLERRKNLSSSPALGVSESNQSASPNHHQTRGGWTRVYNHAAQSTLREGSTIDNILRQYKGSDVESINTGIRPGSSLHRNLSQLTDESAFLSRQNDLRGQSQRSHCPNIFPARNIGLPRSTAETDMASIVTAPPVREPLEKVVMMLRCHSDDSLNSNAYSAVHGGRPLHPSPKHRQEQLSRQMSEPVSIDEETRCLARTALVYNEVSMDPTWNAEEKNVVRTPAKARTRQPRLAVHDTFVDSALRGDRDDDWLTVSSDEAPQGHRISSSIGTVSTLEGINCVDVPERVVQHPAAVHYEGSYRPLSLKNYKVPVMAPSKGPYRINGFPADSLRSKPQLNHYKQPSPLTIHRNPFTGQPPKIPLKAGDKMGLRGLREKHTYAASSSSLTTGKTFSAARSESTLPRLKRWDENDPILSTMNSIPTIHPDHMAHSRKYHRQPEDRIRTATVAGPSHYQHCDSNSTMNASGNKLSRAQGDGVRSPAYTGQGRPRVNRPRHQFPNPYKHSEGIDSQASLLDTRPAKDNITHSQQKSARCPSPRRLQHTFTIEEPRHQIKDTVAKQERVTLVFLILCNLFPPLLAFFWLGKLDNIIGWWTRWEFHEFSKRGKRIACILSALWLAATLIALIVVLFVHLALYLKGRHH